MRNDRCVRWPAEAVDSDVMDGLQLLELEEAVATAQASADAANIRVEELAISLEQARRHVERQGAQLAAATSLATQTASAALAAQTAASSGTASPSSTQSALNRTATASAVGGTRRPAPFGLLMLTSETRAASEHGAGSSSPTSHSACP